jgi:hypothetical protein
LANETVLIFAEGLDAGLDAALASACGDAAVRPVRWQRTAAPPPSLAVAALPRGERLVPEDVLFTSERAFPGLPVLLLVRENLARETVSLAGGRMTAIGLPLSRERLAATIRSGVAARPVPPGPPITGIRVRTFRSAGWWAGTLVKAPGEAAGPWVEDAGDAGVTAAIPARPDAPVPPEARARAVAALSGAAAAPDIPDAPAVAAARLLPTPGGTGWEWSLWRPGPDVSVRLFSPSRVPSAWTVPVGATAVRMPAVPGDLLEVRTERPAPPVAPSDADGDGFLGAAARGGPALLAHLEAAASASAATASATASAVTVTIIEVR